MLIKKTTYNTIHGPRMVIAAAFLAGKKKKHLPKYTAHDSYGARSIPIC